MIFWVDGFLASINARKYKNIPNTVYVLTSQCTWSHHDLETFSALPALCGRPVDSHHKLQQATGLDAWASRVKCPARFVSHLHEICIYIYELFIAFVFLLFVHYYNLMVCVVYWVGKWRSRGSTGMFGNLMAIYHIMLQFIQNHYKSTFS